MQADTKQMWECFWQMKRRIDRLETLEEQFGRMVAEHPEQMGEDALVIKNRMEKERLAEAKLCRILERIVRNYEQTETQLRWMQEDGMHLQKTIQVGHRDLSAVKQWMKEWKLV